MDLKKHFETLAKITENPYFDAKYHSNIHREYSVIKDIVKRKDISLVSMNELKKKALKQIFKGRSPDIYG